MEVDDKCVAGTSNEQPGTAEFRNIFYTSMPLLLNNEDNIVQRLGIVIQDCRDHYQYYVPPILDSQAEYEAKLPHYTAFISWLLGQLVRATTMEKLECSHSQFVDWQMSILDLLATRDQNMFVVIIKEYLTAIKDLVKAKIEFLVSSDSPQVFQWFSQALGQVDNQPPLDQFQLDSSIRCSSIVIHLLKVVRSQTYRLCECELQFVENYWGYLLSLLEDSRKEVVVAALDSVSANINCRGFPNNIVIVRKLCVVLDGILGGVSMKVCGNCDNNDNIRPLLISFSTFFKAVHAQHGTGTEVNDFQLFHTLISLIDFENPVLYSGCTSKDYCKLLVTFLEKFPSCIDIARKLSPLLKHASYFPAILIVLELLIRGEIEKNSVVTPKSSRCVKELSNLWASLLNVVSQTLQGLKAAPSSDMLLPSAKFLSAILSMVANISFHFKSNNAFEPPLVFFGDEFYHSYNNLLIDMDQLIMIYFEMTMTSKHLITLQEISQINETEVYKLIAFLSVPWLKDKTSVSLPGVNLAPYIEMANLHIFTDDGRSECVEGLLGMSGSQGLEWRLSVLNQAQRQPEIADSLLPMLPLLISQVTEDHLPAVLNQLLDPYFISLHTSIVTSLSKFVPSFICALARTAQLTRNTSGKLCVVCRVCNSIPSEEPVFIEGSLEKIAISILENYLKLRNNQSIDVRRNVAISLKYWSKHIKEDTLKKYLIKWLAFIKDEESKVRLGLADVAGHLVSQHSDKQFLDIYADVVMAVAHRSLTLGVGPCHRKEKDLQLSILATLHNIGRLPLDNILWPTLRAFVFFLGHPSVMNPSLAQIYLKNVAVVRNKSVQELFFRFQDEIFKMVSLMLIHNQLFNPNCVSVTLLNLTRGLSFESIKELLDSSARKYLLKYLLPLLVKRPDCDSMASQLLSLLAAASNTQVSKLLKSSFKYIYPHAFLFEDKTTLQGVCNLMEHYTELPLQRLICISFKVIMCELLLYFHKDKAKVTEALSELRKFESETSAETRQSSSFTTETEIAQFIQPRFLGVLAYLDSILVSRSGCESTKRQALLTLPDLIKLMGTVHITPVRFKVLATLRSALNLYHNYFPELICFAWRAFVLNVSTLGPLLSTIFVSLLPLLDQYPVEISCVFRILVVDNLEAVSGHLGELYFVPDTPATHQIYTLVQQELERLRNLPVKDQLAVTLRLATHENSDVRLRGLNKLRSELSLHRQHIIKLIMGNDTMDPFILKLLEALIASCRDSDEGVRLASAQCLGEIGALDPGHLPNKIKMEGEEKEMSFIIKSEEFVMRALSEFVRAFQAANHTTTMDSFAFGIQELLKIYNVPSSNVWNQLSDSTKEIISPFRESHYRDVVTDSDNQAQIPHPIFGTIPGVTFKMWAVNWACRLIPTVTDDFVRKVFSVCQLGLKKDLQTLLFFLPYIVLYAVLGATKSQSKRIAEEMSTVLFWREDPPSLYADTTPRSILTSSTVQDVTSNPEELLTHTLCAKTVYQLFDFLYRWMRQTREKIKPNEESPLSAQYLKVIEFLKNFSKLKIAEGSYSCKEYTRSLLFLEEYIIENPNTLQSYLPSLGKIYYQLHDPDSFKGIIAIHEAEPTAQEMILYHEVTGKLQDAAACYERLGQEHMPSEDFYKAMVQCYLGMDQPSTALHLAQGFLNSVNKSQQSLDLLDEQAEAMLSLSMFPQLESLVEGRGEGGWGVSLGRTLLYLSKRQGDHMITGLDTMRKSLVGSLSTCSVSHSGYRHGYDVIVKLHILTELERLSLMVLEMLDCRTAEQMSAVFQRVVREDLDERLKVVQPSCRVLQPVLCIRRVVLSLAQQMFSDSHPDMVKLFTTEIGNSWLKSIEIARKSGHYQQAYTNILTVEPYKPKGLFVEKAKLLWAKSDPEAALNTLQRGIEHHFPDAAEFKNLSSNVRLDDRRLCAEAKLLIAVYNDENVNIDMETNLANYQNAVEVCRNWEKSIVCLAQYKYKYLRTFCDNPEFLEKTLEYQVYMINYFGKSLQYGCEYIYQSMPRMLSIWLDFGTQLAQDTMSNRNTATLAPRRAAMDKMTTLIGTYIERLPTYMFMTAFSQLISRICHPQKDCYKILRAIIIKIIIAYPQQALWMFLSVYKSPYTARVRRCEEVLHSNEIQKEGDLCRTISDFQHLVERLIELGSKPVPNTRGVATVSIKSFLSSLYRLVSSPTFSRVLIPLQKFRTISLPRTISKYHNPFSDDMVYICGMKDDVVILSSLQKPKKITFIGTDGKQYPMMCKPNDDLRLDSRMMEFNSIVNMYLQRDPEARDRGLYIRTYSAVPLNDTSGLIEWLPNLVGLRNIIHNTYKRMGILMSSKEYKEICCARSDPLSKKRQVFLEKLLPRHPAVLREWYLREFSHPTTWYLARTGYVRTLAVMSIVGFILGLGDRHGENILLDATCGDVVHVDFNCLFNKGERFDWPERVPFRLTHNMVSAMGPTGVEGMFRHSCEITTRVMRQQIDQLMSVVRPFCYDPLVTWNTNSNARDENAEMTNEKAMEDIQNIESRLQGIVRTRNRVQTIPLSVEGQVRTLIAEATNVDNLCQMYIGWGPYL